MSIKHWMSWEGGVDLVAMTEGATEPNIIVHVARMVHTPVGSAPSGMILIQSDPSAQPDLMGFISTDETVGKYFGPNIFAGTPFEAAPTLPAKIEVTEGKGQVSALIEVSGKQIHSTLTIPGPMDAIVREAGSPLPFSQMLVEAAADSATLQVDDQSLDSTLPPVGIAGGPAASWSATGIYAR